MSGSSLPARRAPESRTASCAFRSAMAALRAARSLSSSERTASQGPIASDELGGGASAVSKTPSTSTTTSFDATDNSSMGGPKAGKQQHGLQWLDESMASSA